MIQLHDLFFKKYISKTQINQVINGVVVKINDDYKGCDFTSNWLKIEKE